MIEPQLFITIGLILAASVFIAHIAGRLGVPALVVFLALGMLLGSDGVTKIQLSNAEIAQSVGVIGLIAILFEGGLSTSFRRLRSVAVPAILLSTVGVIITAFLAGFVSHYIFDLSWKYSFLLGAVVSSTDAAAVFATLRYTSIKRKLARTLEAETGINDPVAIALTLGFISWVQHSQETIWKIAELMAKELTIGLAAGLIFAFIARQIFCRLPNSIGSFAPVVSIATCVLVYGFTDLLGGSGFLAIYLVALAIGSTPSRYRGQLTNFHEGLAFLAQVLMFIILGLFVLPHNLPAVALPSIIFAALLIIFIRPISVFLSMFNLDFSTKDKLLLGYAGLRGAVPIVLATFAVSANIPKSEVIFNIVFFVVLISALIQGTSLEWVAKKLGVVDNFAENGSKNTNQDSIEKIRFVVADHHSINGAMIKEVGLPKNSKIAVVVRNSKRFKPNHSTIILAGDNLIINAPLSMHPEVEDVFSRWRRRI